MRDSFTIPKAEYLVLDTLSERALKLSREVKKSELLRAGIKALAALSITALLAALSAVPTIKTGRPVADKPPLRTNRPRRCAAQALRQGAWPAQRKGPASTQHPRMAALGAINLIATRACCKCA